MSPFFCTLLPSSLTSNTTVFGPLRFFEPSLFLPGRGSWSPPRTKTVSCGLKVLVCRTEMLILFYLKTGKFNMSNTNKDPVDIFWLCCEAVVPRVGPTKVRVRIKTQERGWHVTEIKIDSEKVGSFRSGLGSTNTELDKKRLWTHT